MGISVIQPGARLHYAVPAIFARAGLLDALYTDIHGEHAALRALDAALPAAAKTKAIRRLLGRRLPDGLPIKLVNDRPLEVLASTVADMIGLSTYGTHRITARMLLDLEKSSISAGDIVYTSLINEDLETMHRLKDRGVTIVHECFIGPDVGSLVAEERAAFPGVDFGPDKSATSQGMQRDAEKYAVADVVLVPSKFTACSVAAVAPKKCRIEMVPYGFDPAKINNPAQTEKGRILCVGSVGVRKGHPYLALAAQRLLKEGSGIEVRVVGPHEGIDLSHPVMRGPRYVGQVPRSQIRDEFERADVFVLPTICDSFGIVLLEAMAAGLPVIATPNCGDVVRDGVDGFIVPPRSPEALADRIKQLVEDRDLRNRMSIKARERVLYFSVERYAQRLLQAMPNTLDTNKYKIKSSPTFDLIR